MSLLFRLSFKTAIFSRLLKVAIATSNFVNEVYNGGFAPEFRVSMIKETIALVGDYVFETREWKAKLAEKYIGKENMKSFFDETLNFFFRKFWASYILDLAKTVRALQILWEKFTRNFGIKELWALENHILVNMLLWSSHFTEGHYVYIGTYLKTFSLPFPCPSYLDTLLRLPSLADF